MYVSIRPVVGLFKILPYPDFGDFWSFVHSSFTNYSPHVEGTRFTIKFSTIQEADVALENLVSSLKRSQYIPTGVPIAPLQFIAHEEHNPDQSLWQIAPAGYFLIRDWMEIQHKEDWIYGCSLVNVAYQMPVSNQLFPYRLILINGDLKQECYFCGSRWHSTKGCKAFFRKEGHGDEILKRLAYYTPEDWKEHIKDEKKNISFITGLYAIHEALRFPFRPFFAIKTLYSSVNEYIYEQELEPSLLTEHLKEIYEAFNANDLKALRASLSKGFSEHEAPLIHTMRAMLFLYEGDADSALSELQSGEILCKNAGQRAYILLLEARLQLFWHGIEGARAAVNKAKTLFSHDPLIKRWDVIISCIERNTGSVHRTITSMSNAVEWLIQIMCEPLSLAYGNEIEKIFKGKLELIEDKVDQDKVALENLISQFQSAFPDSDIDHILIPFRDLNGVIPKLGLKGLQEAHDELINLWSKVYNEINKNYIELYGRLLDARKLLASNIKRLPDSGRLGALKAKCVKNQRSLTDFIKKVRVIKKIREMKELGPSVEKWENLVNKLVAEVEAEIEKAYQAALIKKYCSIGISVTLVVWLLVYLYTILKEYL